ncbi:MAG: cysteine--tRNA ligase [Candidatus Diapherotrites archaeon]|nr:cysteine--tRNA ligase [Candidatus Diapherotrites archaeon]
MIYVHNTMGDKKEPFKPEKKGIVRMYVCGPTVYGPAHIGHARTYIAFDIIRRYLEWKGYNVKLVINITDVHDDMIARANELNTTIFELADKFIKKFFADMKALKVKEASVYPRVTQEIEPIIETIKILEEKGYAYETKDGVYYDISKFPEYGKLSGIKPSKSITGTRVETDRYDKRSVQDFALWKKAKPNEPFWESPWGEGRPGWHIECSVMSSKYLGLPIDIHGGAVDLIFPHHENEIAQSEAAYDVKPFVKYWLHTGFLVIEGQKMSKSLGNFITVPELLEKYDARVFRFFIATKHYRSRVDFAKDAMVHATNTLKRLDDFIQRLYEVEASGPCNVDAIISKAKKEFEQAMDDDFNAPLAWRAIFNLETEANRLMAANKLTKDASAKIIDFLKDINRIFDVFSFERKQAQLAEEDMRLIKLREKLRKEKRFAEADKIREQLKKKGIILIDTPEGTKWRLAQ